MFPELCIRFAKLWRVLSIPLRKNAGRIDKEHLQIKSQPIILWNILTWSDVYSITEQVKGLKWNLFFNGPGNGMVMQDGKLVFPAQYWDENAMPHATIIYSDDHGKSWTSGRDKRFIFCQDPGK